MPKTTQQRLKQLLDYDPATGVFTWRENPSNRTVGMVAGGVDSKGYTRIRVDGYQYKAHHLAWLYFYGEWPSQQIDHANRNGGDNSIANLRLATASQNNANRKLMSSNTSGFAGVRWHKRDKRWIASIRCNGKLIWLGSYISKNSAAIARAEAERMYFGEFIPN